MGLESVEIVMEIEDEFGIKIPDEDCERILTIGGVTRYVKTIVAENLSMPKERLRADTRFADILP